MPQMALSSEKVEVAENVTVKGLLGILVLVEALVFANVLGFDLNGSLGLAGGGQNENRLLVLGAVGDLREKQFKFVLGRHHGPKVNNEAEKLTCGYSWHHLEHIGMFGGF